MGYMRHHAIVVTSWDDELIQTAHGVAVGLFTQAGNHASVQPSDFTTLVTPVGACVVNGGGSFAILPDGSKEGWGHSNAGESARAQLIEWLEQQRYDDLSTSIQWVEVQFGDDEWETKVTNDSDRARREQEDDS
jgi:hypothetical protein